MKTKASMLLIVEHFIKSDPNWLTREEDSIISKVIDEKKNCKEIRTYKKDKKILDKIRKDKKDKKI